jgi:hypothetical protein
MAIDPTLFRRVVFALLDRLNGTDVAGVLARDLAGDVAADPARRFLPDDAVHPSVEG